MSHTPPFEKPFLIEIRQDRPQPDGSFIPAASLKVNEELRTSGLLHALDAEDLKSLMYLLTFLSPEGHCSVSQPILTSAMRLSSSQVQARMHRLAQVCFQNTDLIIETPHESGIYTFSLHPRWVAYEHLTASPPHNNPPLYAVPRDQVIAHSRKHYARPRAEVERMVAQQMGLDVAETEEQRQLRYRLENAGLTGEQAKEVIATYDAGVIAQQLDWLPYRHAKNPAGYLLAAIDGGYQEPRAVREQRFVLEEKLRANTLPESEGLSKEELVNAAVDVAMPEFANHISSTKADFANEPANFIPPLEIGDELLSLPEE